MIFVTDRRVAKWTEKLSVFTPSSFPPLLKFQGKTVLLGVGEVVAGGFGRWCKIRRDETLVALGWEGLFSEVASFRDVGEGMFCDFRLSYKRLDFEMFSKGVVEAASRFDFGRVDRGGYERG